MADITIQAVVSFEALVDAVSSLSLKDKNRLWELLYEQIEQEEEDLMQQDPEIRTRMDDARAALKAGDYVTLEDYTAQRAKAHE